MTSESGQHVKTLRIVLLALAAFLAACGKPMSNDAIIPETKKCEGAGMEAIPLSNDLNYGVTLAIQCQKAASK